MDRSDLRRLYDSDDPADHAELERRALENDEIRSWLAFERRVDRAAKGIRPTVRTDSFAQVLERHRASLDSRTPSRTPSLRSAPLAAAAALILLAIPTFWWIRALDRSGSDPSPRALSGLLDDSTLAAVTQRRVELDSRHALLVSKVGSSDSAADALDPLREEVRFLDAAIDECRQVLEHNRHHQHLQERILELSDRRVRLLERLADRTGDRG